MWKPRCEEHGLPPFSAFLWQALVNNRIGDAVLIMLDSSRPDKDDGEVCYRQRLWLRECLENYHDKFKIVAMHHHLLPAPDTEWRRT